MLKTVERAANGARIVGWVGIIGGLFTNFVAFTSVNRSHPELRDANGEFNSDKFNAFIDANSDLSQPVANWGPEEIVDASTDVVIASIILTFTSFVIQEAAKSRLAKH